jgi:hypothetical protein
MTPQITAAIEALERLEQVDWTDVMREGSLVTWGDASTLGYRVVERVRAELAGLRSLQSKTGWQSIETAPKPQTDIFGNASMVLVHWKRNSRDESLSCIDVSNTYYLAKNKEKATHWMPLPQPPKGDSDV